MSNIEVFLSRREELYHDIVRLEALYENLCHGQNEIKVNRLIREKEKQKNGILEAIKLQERLITLHGGDLGEKLRH